MGLAKSLRINTALEDLILQDNSDIDDASMAATIDALTYHPCLKVLQCMTQSDGKFGKLTASALIRLIKADTPLMDVRFLESPALFDEDSGLALASAVESQNTLKTLLIQNCGLSEDGAAAERLFDALPFWNGTQGLG